MNISLPNDARDYNIRIWDDSVDDYHDKRTRVQFPHPTCANQQKMMQTKREYLPQTWTDPRIAIKKSSISGGGMFAREPIKKGEIICIIGGMAMAEPEFKTFQASHSNYNAIQIDEDLHLVEQPEITQSLDGSMNHSCDSNVWMEDEVTLAARRDIAAEEEITVDYALFTTQPNWILEKPCHCGSPYCRHTITGNDWTLIEVQERYCNHFSPFINRRIERLIEGNVHG